MSKPPTTACSTLSLQSLSEPSLLRVCLAAFFPFIGAAMQWLVWPYLSPVTWLFFYPAIFFSASLGGLFGGLMATLLSVWLAIYFFIPPQISWAIGATQHSLSIVIFCLMGILFSLFHARLHRIQAELIRSNALHLDTLDAQLNETQRLAGLGSWLWDLGTNKQTWSAETYRIYQLDATQPPPSYPELERLFSAQSWQKITQAVEQALSQGLEYACDAEMIRPDGSRCWITARGAAVRNPAGEIIQLHGTIEDITQRKQAELITQQSEQRFRRLFQECPLALGLVNRDGVIVSINTRFEQLFGFTTAEIPTLAEWWLCAYPEPSYRTYVEEQWNAAVWRATALGTDIEEHEYRITCRNGDIRDVIISGIVAGDEFMASFYDVTERNKLEREVSIGKETLQAALNSMTDAVFISDASGQFIEFNDAFASFHKFKNKHECAKTLTEYTQFLEIYTLNGERLPVGQWAVPRALQGEISTNSEFKLRRTDTQETWIGSYNFAPILNPEGLVVGSVVTARDITERRRISAALAASEKEFRTLAESMPQIVWIADSDGLNSYFNQHWVDYTGLSLQQSYGQGWLQPLHPDDRQLVEDAWHEAVNYHITFAIECRFRRADGKYRWWLVRGVPIFDEQGQISKWFGTSTDIHELKEQARLLADSQAIGHIGSWRRDFKTDQAEWSAETYRLLGWPTNNPYPPNFAQLLDLLEPEDRPVMQVWSKDCLAGKKPKPIEIRTHSLEGNFRWLLASAELELDANGEPRYIIGTVQDITESKRLHEEMQRWADAFRYCAHGIVIGDPLTNQIKFCNQAFAQMEGYADPEQLKGYPMLSLYAADSQERVKHYLQEADQWGHVSHEAQHIHQNGSTFDVQIDLVSVKDVNDNLLYRVATVQNISQRKQAESRAKLQSKALEAAANGILIFDKHGIIEWVNPAFTVMTGFSLSDAIGSTPQALFQSAEQDADFFAKQWEVISSGQVWQGEILNRRKDGSYYSEEKTITPVVDEQGIIQHYITIKQDVTERQRNKAELQRYQNHLEQLIEERTFELMEARDEAQRLTEVKSSFIANMSHEIRSPMNAVLGICYLLEQRPLDQESRQLLAKMHQAGDSLLAIINDILDFSKIEAGRIEIEQLPFSLVELLEQLASLMSAVAESKKLELIINPPPFPVNKLIGDGLRLQQVLVNLLSNAIKFTPQGEVELAIQIEQELDRRIVLSFSVRDTGIGISAAQQTEIFSAFTQADTTITRRFGGSGLGLCISQELVKLMGGNLLVSSQLGSGSEFRFSLAFDYDSRVERTPAYLSRLELLIADDSVTAGAALLNTAKSLGWKADVVTSGASAVQQVSTRWDSNKPYDLILLDWKMPDKNGLETALTIQETLDRHYPEFNALPMVIMVTAHSRDELRQEAAIDRVDAILSKPVTPSVLYNTIADICIKREQLEVVDFASASTQKRIANIRLLVVDDSEINREVAQRILEAEGGIVSCVADGQEAVELLNAAVDSFDLVLMDIQMPRMDGYTATRLLRQNPRWASLPIIALTAGAFESFKHAAYESGMNDFVSKPFNVEQLLATIQRYTQSQPLDTGLQNRPEQLAPLLAQPLAKATARLLALPGINVATGLELWGEAAAYEKMLVKFADTYKNAGHELAQCLRDADSVAAFALSHKLKGVAGNLALQAIADSVSQFEAHIQLGESAISATAALQKAIDAVCTAIAQWDTLDEPVAAELAATDPAALEILLTQLLTALDLDNPEQAEPLLLNLRNRIPETAFNLLRNQLSDFDFRQAEETIRRLIQQLNFH
jgi:PAS domain S-box-containing protein